MWDGAHLIVPSFIFTEIVFMKKYYPLFPNRPAMNY